MLYKFNYFYNIFCVPSIEELYTEQISLINTVSNDIIKNNLIYFVYKQMNENMPT
jgi:hypothetical protein